MHVLNVSVFSFHSFVRAQLTVPHLEWLVVCRSRLVFVTASDIDGYQDCILIEGRIDQCCTIEVAANNIFYL